MKKITNQKGRTRMSKTDCITKSRKFHHLTEIQRGQIQVMLEMEVPKVQIAVKVGISRSTLYEELKRGTVIQMNSDLTTREQYFAETGQIVYEKNRQKCRKPFKIAKAEEFVEYAEEKIIKEKLSPDSVAGYAKKQNLFEETVCTKTLYNYIDNGLIEVKNIDLAQKVRRKPKRKHSREYRKKLGKSIELRPKVVDDREEFGHWEIDTVIGKSEADEVLLTLDERKTRKRYIMRLPAKKAQCVTEALKSLKQYYDDKFSQVFKSITADNGSEFANLSSIGVPVYFAHPYSSWERGTNERQNGLVRFFIPKGKAISEVSDRTIKRAEDWINKLPRKLFNYTSSEELFDQEISLIYAA